MNSFREQEDFEGFKLACIVNFGLDTNITEEEFKKGDINTVIERLYMKQQKITTSIKKN